MAQCNRFSCSSVAAISLALIFAMALNRSPMQTVIPLSPKRIVTFLGFTVAGFVLANLLKIILQYGFQRSSFFGLGLFDLDIERSIPTWFSSAQLLLCAILLALIAQVKQVVRDGYRFHWAMLSAIFVLFSIDEALAFHERSIKPLRNALNTSGFLHFAWVIPAALFVLVMLLFYRRFLLHLPAKTRRLFLVAGGIYVMGSLGMEILSGPVWEAVGKYRLIKDLLIVVEETLELIGIEIFIYALLMYLGQYLKDMRFAIDADRLVDTANRDVKQNQDSKSHKLGV
jgi:hypothetical protein